MGPSHHLTTRSGEYRVSFATEAGPAVLSLLSLGQWKEVVTSPLGVCARRPLPLPAFYVSRVRNSRRQRVAG